MSRFRFGRRQTLGVIFGLARALPRRLRGAATSTPADKGVTFEPPPDPAKIIVDPTDAVTAIGIVFMLVRRRDVLRAALAAPGRAAR